MDAFDVDGVGPHPYLSATIRVKISCRDPELHRALKHHERAVQEQLNDINQRIRPRFLFADLIYEIEPAGYQPVDLKYTVDTSAALHLFMGNRLYADKRVFLRELIQNAVDACSMRKLADKAYVPAISIAFNDDISRITIRDNGIGMDRQWLEKYFLSIGISFYQSDEVKTVNEDPRIDIGFISQFGIGFLSSFLVAEKIVIKTRKGASPGLLITITSLKDYFDVRPLGDDAPAGTEVTLHLKPSRFNYCRRMEFVGYLKTNIRFLQIPVRFTDERGDSTIIGNEPISYAAVQNADSDFVAPVTFDDAEGFIYLGAKNERFPYLCTGNGHRRCFRLSGRHLCDPGRSVAAGGRPPACGGPDQSQRPRQVRAEHGPQPDFLDRRTQKTDPATDPFGAGGHRQPSDERP